MKPQILLIGSSIMAEEYLKTLSTCDCDVHVLGRDSTKAEHLAKKYNRTGSGGGHTAIPQTPFSHAIIACAIESLKDTTASCLTKGITNILIEKPGGLTPKELSVIKKHAGNATIHIAYNRRYYNSVRMLKKKLQDDGGPLGCFFDFTDREKDILLSSKSSEVISRWGWANSSHVIDTAFYLIGQPNTLTCQQSGGFDVHTSGTTFSGCGKTNQCDFSYFATWSGGGRWNIEISTTKGRYKLSPLEELQFCAKNQFTWETLPLPDTDDKDHKPGLKKMVNAFLSAEHLDLPDINEQITSGEHVFKIFGYSL